MCGEMCSGIDQWLGFSALALSSDNTKDQERSVCEHQMNVSGC